MYMLWNEISVCFLLLSILCLSQLIFSHCTLWIGSVWKKTVYLYNYHASDVQSLPHILLLQLGSDGHAVCSDLHGRRLLQRKKGALGF